MSDFGHEVPSHNTATVDQRWQLSNPFGDVEVFADREITRVGELIRCDLKAHQTLKLHL